MRFSSVIIASLTGSLVVATPVELQKRHRVPLPNEYTPTTYSSYSDPSKSPAVVTTTNSSPQDDGEVTSYPHGDVVSVNGERYFRPKRAEQDPSTPESSPDTPTSPTDDDDCEDDDNVEPQDYQPEPQPPVVIVKNRVKRPTPSYTMPTYGTPYTPPTPPAPAAEPVAQTQPSNSNDPFQKKMLDNHNRYRAMHGAPPVTWNDDMVAVSERNCQQCTMKHTSNNKYGENLAMGTNMDADMATKMWYDEESLFPWDALASGRNIAFNGAWGHFSQLVWVGAPQIGCSQRKCGDGNTYIACQYTTGNVGGQYAKNVKPKISGGSKTTY